MWSKEHQQCNDCGTTERRHYAKGLCLRCYHKRRWLDDEYRAKHKERCKDWNKRNIELKREIDKKAIKAYYERNKIAICAKNKERYHNDPAYLAKVREYQKNYYLKRKDSA